MRVEHQGTIEVQPVYGHVGYTSAMAYMAYTTSGAKSLPALSLGVLTLVVALALSVAWRARRRSARAIALFAVLAAMLTGAAAIVASPAAPRQPTPEFALTLYRLEEACAMTETLQAALGRLPSATEWRQRAQRQQCAVDGWGYPFRYERLATPGQDGRRYLVACTELHAADVPRVPQMAGAGRHGILAVGTDWLGPDGHFGTTDDAYVLARTIRWNPAAFAALPHGRAVR